MNRNLLIGCSAIAALLVVAILGRVFFFDANQFRPQLEQTMGEALGRKGAPVDAAIVGIIDSVDVTE